MNSLSIQYKFIFPNKKKEIFNLELDPEHIKLLNNVPDNLPEWTNLDFFQCPHCPLKIKSSPYCPLARKIFHFVSRLDGIQSYDSIHLEIVTKERVIIKDTTAQRGVSSMMGLVMPVSGCPITAFFKPMARFHLPLASEEETIFRATSMYLLAQYFLHKNGKKADMELAGLKKIYHDIQIVNINIAKRLRAISETDSSINALILLDIFARVLPSVIEESLEEIQYLYSDYL